MRSLTSITPPLHWAGQCHFVESMAVQRGLTGPQRLPHEVSSEVPSESRQLHVLVVEDMPVNQLLQSRLLEQMGYAVTLANHGLEGVEAFERGQFEVILMDIQMPEMGGVEATQVIRGLEQAKRLHRTPIIAVTAHARQVDRDLYVAAGMDGYVSKPLSKESLKTELDRVLAHKQWLQAPC